MKYLSKFLLLSLVTTTFFACIKKAEDLPFFTNGKAVTVTSSKASIAATPNQADSVVWTLSWSSPAYATDTANMKYIIEIDSAGRNFAKAASKTVIGNLKTTFTGDELNQILLNFGFNFNVSYKMDVRITSSYGNNNERLSSNVLNVQMTPYKVPPKITPPTSNTLFVVGAATQGGWNNPVPVPTQQFSKLDETTYAGVFELIGGNQYLVLPENGNWDKKYSIANNQLPGVDVGGDFGYNLDGNFVAPGNSGWYKITLNFQTGKYTVTPYGGTLPTELYIVGDASPGGWSNPVPVPSQKFTALNSSEFEITLDITGGKSYLLLPMNGSWDNKYAVADDQVPGIGMGGELGFNFSKNIPSPTTSGKYKINVNFAKGVQGQFKLTPQ
jgi:hypothetical protein